MGVKKRATYSDILNICGDGGRERERERERETFREREGGKGCVDVLLCKKSFVFSHRSVFFSSN